MRPPAVFTMRPASLVGQIFDADAMAALVEILDIDSNHVITEVTSTESRSRLQRAEIVIGGWGAEPISADVAPNLRAVIFAGGVAATCLDRPADFGARGVVASNARAANAIPVAEYALAMILLANKQTFAAERTYRTTREGLDRATQMIDVGNYRRKVGIVGAGLVASELIARLRGFDLDVIVFDPLLTVERAVGLGVGMRSLEEVMATSDVISLHQAVTPATVGQINARLLGMMRDGATLLNTARGALVDQEALIAELRTGRIHAILDVTEPEPLPADSELWQLPNAVLTPHIAGSMGNELHRIGASVVAEVRRFVAGAPFEHPEQLG